ncbi:hypothetical protein [Rhodobium gokarnense]|uniref:Uncharacterized protein n=1 Tax=Rhodobium gokarnense TaxID=364296 RepID=A0ABT3H987_9HYPH|nr:hypothetical protein [Rhodobium gokarnense]MCW2306899.1 hypothetical protein [Rhodobium gokarnense]
MADPFQANRVILIHKQPTSARIRFFLHDSGSICGFAPLPEGAAMAMHGGGVVAFPGTIVTAAAEQLGLDASDLAAEPGFAATVDADGRQIHIHLARFTSIDPPFEMTEEWGGKFIELTEARSLPPVELQLLRDAYEALIG